MTHRTSAYEDPEYAEAYAALWAFGYLNGFGQSEGLYRTVAALASEVTDASTATIIDLGSGVGRTAADLAVLRPAARVVAVDSSEVMATFARRILTTEEIVTCDLSHRGFGQLSIPGLRLGNVEVVVSSLEAFCERSVRGTAQLVTMINVIDRLHDPRRALHLATEQLEPDGVLIVATPFNNQTTSSWKVVDGPAALAKLGDELGLRQIESFDGLPYVELEDARGNHAVMRTCVSVFQRTAET